MRLLRSQEEIMAKWQGDPNKPVVSICCITFNHELYIEDALEGFLIQETDFPFEILIHDDASTDQTTEIIRKYEKKYPFLIKPVCQVENQFSQGKRIAPIIVPKTNGKYIAICEGDDYWTSSSKLQRQVDILENNPDCIVCGGRSFVIRENSSTPYCIVPSIEPERIYQMPPIDMLKGLWYLKTLTRVFRKDTWANYIDIVKNDSVSCDWLFMLYCASEAINTGKTFRCLNDVIGVYREHPGGIWFGASQKEKEKTNINILSFALNNFEFGSYAIILEQKLIALCTRHNISRIENSRIDLLLTIYRYPIPKSLMRIIHQILS